MNEHGYGDILQRVKAKADTWHVEYDTETGKQNQSFKDEARARACQSGLAAHGVSSQLRATATVRITVDVEWVRGKASYRR